MGRWGVGGLVGCWVGIGGLVGRWVGGLVGAGAGAGAGAAGAVAVAVAVAGSLVVAICCSGPHFSAPVRTWKTSKKPRSDMEWICWPNLQPPSNITNR